VGGSLAGADVLESGDTAGGGGLGYGDLDDIARSDTNAGVGNRSCWNVLVPL